MLVMLHAKYPGKMAKQTIDAFLSPDIPKRPDAKDLASFAYVGHDGAHALFIFDVEEGKLAEWLRVQGERNVFMSSRIDGFNVEVQTGMSIADAIQVASRLLPQ